MFSFITEILSLFSHQLDNQVQKIGSKAWNIAYGIALALVSALLLLISIGFFGCSIYQQLVISMGQPLASFIVGGFFLLIAIILLIISKKLIKKN